MHVIEQWPARHRHRLGNRHPGETAVPLLNNRPPLHAFGDLIEDVRDQNTGPAKRRLTVTNLRIRRDVTPKRFSSHLPSDEIWGFVGMKQKTKNRKGLDPSELGGGADQGIRD